MCSKSNRIILIEPDSTRLKLIRSALAESSSPLEFKVVSSQAEAQLHLDGSTSTMVFSALSLPVLSDEAGGNAEPEKSNSTGSLPDQQQEAAILASKLSNFSHALRGSLGVILNSTFLLKRKGAADHALLAQYLDVIEQQVMTAQQILSDYVHSAK
jgi:hypothetical protein